MNPTIENTASLLTFTAHEGRTLVTEQLSIQPLKIVNTQPSNSTGICMLTNYGGGFVGGDTIALEVLCKARTTSIVSSQANTRVYESDGEPCVQKLSITLEKEAVHVFFNDPLVMHKGSAFTQQTDISVQENSVLVYIDWFSSGRTENQESFSFTQYRAETKIMQQQRHLLWDRFHISPSEIDIGSPGMFKDHTSFLNVFVIGNAELPKIKRLEKELQDRCPSIMAPSIKGQFTRINPDALVGRYSAKSTLDLQKVIQEIATVVSHPELLSYHPLHQKY